MIKAKEVTAGGCASWAVTPADRTNTTSAVVAWFVAQACLLLLVFGAGQYFAHASPVGVFMAGNPDVGHSQLAIRGAHATSEVVETITAYWVPEKTVLFTNRCFCETSVVGCVADAAAIGVWLSAVSSVITEASGAFLPAHGSVAAVTFFALVVAQ